MHQKNNLKNLMDSLDLALEDIIFIRQQDGKVLDFDTYVKPYIKYLELFQYSDYNFNNEGKVVVALIGF